MDELELTMRYRKLANELNALAKKDKDFKQKYTFDPTKDSAIYLTEKKYKKRIMIQRESMWYTDRFAIQITTAYWNIKSNRYRSDFGIEGLARKLHKRSKKLLEKLKEKGAEEVLLEKRQKVMIAEAKKLFPMSTEIRMGYGQSPPVLVDLPNMLLSSSDGKNFTIYDATVKINKDNLNLIKPLLLVSLMEE